MYLALPPSLSLSLYLDLPLSLTHSLFYLSGIIGRMAALGISVATVVGSVLPHSGRQTLI